METVDSLEALFTWYTNPEFEFETFGADSGASMDSLSGQLDGFVNHHASGERTKLLDSQTWQACTDFVAVRACMFLAEICSGLAYSHRCKDGVNQMSIAISSCTSCESSPQLYEDRLLSLGIFMPNTL
jgi:hypothetical protein